MEFTWKVTFAETVAQMFEDVRFMGEVLLGNDSIFTFDPSKWVNASLRYGIRIVLIELVVTDLPDDIRVEVSMRN